MKAMRAKKVAEIENNFNFRHPFTLEGQIKMIEDDLSRITQLTGVEYKGKLPINSRLLKIAPEICQKYMTES